MLSTSDPEFHMLFPETETCLCFLTMSSPYNACFGDLSVIKDYVGDGFNLSLRWVWLNREDAVSWINYFTERLYNRVFADIFLIISDNGFPTVPSACQFLQPTFSFDLAQHSNIQINFVVDEAEMEAFIR